MTEKSPERAFLHDLSSPLAVADGSVSTLLEELKELNVLNEKQFKKLERAAVALEKMHQLVHQRREELKNHTEKIE